MTLKELRKQKKLTQIQCATYLGIPVRTYQNYETDESKSTSMKYQYMMQKLGQYGFIDENNGILSIDSIKDICNEVFKEYDVEYCYLFGSYAKDKAKPNSDVDLLISSDCSGIHFFDMVEVLREKLKKKVDALDLKQLSGNDELTNEILKDGVKIYG